MLRDVTSYNPDRQSSLLFLYIVDIKVHNPIKLFQSTRYSLSNSSKRRKTKWYDATQVRRLADINNIPAKRI